MEQFQNYVFYYINGCWKCIIYIVIFEICQPSSCGFGQITLLVLMHLHTVYLELKHIFHQSFLFFYSVLCSLINTLFWNFWLILCIVLFKKMAQ